MRLLILPLIVLSMTCFSQELFQTDWSGGPGSTGPDWMFGNRFLESQDIDWSTISGQISILPSWKGIVRCGPVLPATDDAVCSGTLVSSLGLVPMGTNWTIEWGDIEWIAYEPDGSDVYFQLRTGNSPETMGSWGDPITESGTYLGDLLPDTILMIQYMVTLESDSYDPDSFPVLYEVTIWGWYPGGIDDNPAGPVTEGLLEARSNPGRGAIGLRTSLPTLTQAVLEVFDMAGRKVSTLFAGELPGGESEFTFAAPPGTYVARLVTDVSEERVSFVLTE